MSNKYTELELKLIETLMLIEKIGCMQSIVEEEIFCKHDGSKHSCYCPAGIAKKALDSTGVTRDLNS